MEKKIKSATIFCAFASLAFFLAVCLAMPNTDGDRKLSISNLTSDNFFTVCYILSDLVPPTGHVNFVKSRFSKEMPPPSISAVDPSAGLICTGMYSVKKGDTCFSIYTKNKVTREDFYSMNPNVDCRDLFVGQWLCTMALRGN
ncbi:hypothetical protein MLD38_036957 [Melastoma candidum]|uniref:Uncharacterized protein n=1 Tax=Melastoma candidum TaxID=119954 RepID=A0ACB9LL76_9MYRT|nr:hypothetical protein MLD38_036957 [Melastoma candidum]